MISALSQVSDRRSLASPASLFCRAHNDEQQLSLRHIVNYVAYPHSGAATVKPTTFKRSPLQIFSMSHSLGPGSQLPEFLTRLRVLLQPENLPAALPLRDGPDAKYGMFLNFDLDLDILEKTEGEIATYPEDAVLAKWAHDLGAAAEHVYSTHGMQPPGGPATPVCTKTAQKRRRALSVAESDTQELQTTLDSNIVIVKGAQNCLLPSVSKGSRGRPPKELMNAAIEKGTTSSTERRKGKTTTYWTCIAPYCDYRASGFPSEPRVFKHASTCEKLRNSHPDVHASIVDAQSTGSLGAKISDINGSENRSGTQDCDSHQQTAHSTPSASLSSVPSSSEPPAVPVPKKLKTEGTLDAFVAQGVKQKRTAQRAALQQSVDHIIMRLICVRGLVPSIVDSAEWKELMYALNPGYKPSPSDKFTKDYIPKEAAFVRSKQLEEVQKHDNLTITFDGNSTRRDSIYFVHATTPHREHYFISGHVGTDEHHTVPWVKSKILQSIGEIGISRTAAVCSDSTVVTLTTRAEINLEIPTIFDLRDCCHQLHNIIADITKLSAFTEPISTMKKIIAHFSKSTFGRAMLQKETEEGVRLLALQKVGKTRFGSHWTAVQSLLPAMPRIRELVQSKEVKFKHKSIQSLFTGRFNPEYTRLEHALVQYTTIVEPLIRSLWALEASSANAADVFVFFTACAASLRDLFASGQRSTGISPEVAQTITNIFNDRYDEFFFHSDIYFAAFALDPRYPVSDYLLIAPTAEPSITVPRQGADLALPHPRAYDRTKEFIKKSLKDMFTWKHANPSGRIDPVLQELGANKASKEMKTQFEAYWLGEYPFNTVISSESTLSYWENLRSHPNARVLAIVCIKIFSILVNSMPDERTGSKFTWFNSALRGNQHAQTLVDMVQIGQYYSRQSSDGTQHNVTTTRRRPTVRFRDINKDLLQAVQHHERPLATHEAESDSLSDESEDDSSPRDNSRTRDTAGSASIASQGQPSEGSSSSTSGSAPKPSGPGGLLPESVIDLSSPLLLDLLSDKSDGMADSIHGDELLSERDPDADVFIDW
ncbi:hypothetical protein BN946_scf184934.g17 [Trametes cinnabarina]|uniref:DUF659 domain-containing protein n=1 Tax=Pycnoporus cinnabarinus TaxID=5643 RepID=A0A060SMU7_PYCCI|nr:hypothetical protein BN946_scf184934.g17 [Trametes cinnabarina]